MFFVANLDVNVVWGRFLGSMERSERMSYQIECIVEERPHIGIHVKPNSKLLEAKFYIANEAAPKLAPLLLVVTWGRVRGNRLLVDLYVSDHLSNHVLTHLSWLAHQEAFKLVNTKMFCILSLALWRWSCLLWWHHRLELSLRGDLMRVGWLYFFVTYFFLF